MSDRTIASRLRRIGVCLALPIALAGVSAQAADAQTFYPTDGTSLYNDINTANSTPGFNVIQLSDLQYFPGATQNNIITGDVEIIGEPQLQPAQFKNGFAPEINAENQYQSGNPLFTVEPGANFILKGFNLDAGGGATWPLISDLGGNLEVDNMAIYGNGNSSIQTSTNTSNNVVVNSSLLTTSGTGGGAAIVNAAPGQSVTLNNDTIAGNFGAGVAGPFVSHNDLFGGNNGGDCYGPGSTSDDDSEDTDFNCNVTYGGGSPDLQRANNYGGPTLSMLPNADSDVYTNAADPAWCERSDQRFYTAANVNAPACLIGAADPNYTLQSDTAGPTCTVDFTHNSPTDHPQEQQVSAQDVGVAGLGADAIGNTTIVLKGTTTTNGTVSFPTVPNTLFDETAPGTNILDQPSGSAFAVLAQKPSTDTTANDTFWSFTANDWFDNTTLCQ